LNDDNDDASNATVSAPNNNRNPPPLHSPPVNRAKKPNLSLTTSADIIPTLIDFQTPEQEQDPQLPSKSYLNNDTEDFGDFDMSLFDIKSTLNAINASSEINQHLMPPVPPSRKSKSSNRIDKMNYTVDNTKTSPRVSSDRTMGVLYESPNEQTIWDEFNDAKDAGAISSVVNNSYYNYSSSNNSSNFGSPLKSTFPEIFESPRSIDKKKDQYYQLKNNDQDDNTAFRDSLLISNRVRSGSGAKRYEYLSNNVEQFKQDLEKDRALSSPLNSKFDWHDLEFIDEGELSNTNKNNDNSHNTNKIPPPVPQSRKTR
jgi:hypothetical protein